MLKIEDDMVNFDLGRCQQCGICEPVCPMQAISLRLRVDGTHDVIVDHEKCVLCGRCVRACPSNVVNDYSGYFDSFPGKKYYLGYSGDSTARRLSSSGGVCKTLIIEALKSKRVDGAYTLTRTDAFPYAKGQFFTSDDIPAFSDMPNSVYHSVPACAEARELKPCRRMMIVGTSCQLRALAPVAKSLCEELLTVCIFCKQQKTLDSTRFLARVMGTKIGKDLRFTATYRGDGWPGIVKVNDRQIRWARAAQVPFGRRLFSVSGCDICGDSFGILTGADITLMDPWNIRPDNEEGETLVIVNTSRGHDLLKDVGNLHLDEISFSEASPALSVDDVRAKQTTEPYFRGMPCSPVAEAAGSAEQRQRRILRGIVDNLPPLPMILYRVLCKMPDLRNSELRKSQK